MINKIRNLSTDKKKLFSNYFFLSVLQVTNLVLPLITLPYLIRTLNTENFGLVIFAHSFILYFVIFVDYGFSYSATRSISINRENKDKITEIFSVVMFIKVLLVIGSLLILVLVVNVFDKFNADKEIYYLTFLYVIGQAMFPSWYFQGMEDMKYVTYLNIMAKMIFTVFIFILVQDSQDYLYVPLLNGLGFIVAGVLSLWLILKKYNEKFKFYNLETMRFYVKDSTDFFLSRVSVSLYTSSNIFILGLFTNNVTVAHYAIAEKLYVALKSIYGPISQVFYPYMSKNKNILFYKRIFTVIILVNLVMIISLWSVSSWLITVLAGENIPETINAFRIMLMIAIIAVPSSLLGYSFLAALGYKRYANYSVIFASQVHLLGLFVLYLFEEITLFNVIYLLAITESIVFIIRLYAIRKYNLWKLT